MIMLIRQSDIDRFWSYVRKTDTCWNWCGARYDLRHGYGALKINGRTYRSHVLSIVIHHGYLPNECVLHTCDNDRCVNPAHLYEGTRTENIADRTKRGRSATGRKARHTTKLKPSQIPLIKADLASGMFQWEIALKYEISQSIISDINTGKIWTDID